MPAYQVPIGGILMAMAIQGVLLLAFAASVGPLVAIVAAILILALLDIFLLRSAPIIIGQVLGLLIVWGLWFFFSLLGVV